MIKHYQGITKDGRLFAANVNGNTTKVLYIDTLETETYEDTDWVFRQDEYKDVERITKPRREPYAT